MKAENPQTHFHRGLLPLAILSLLKQKDMYGYELVQEMERASDGQLVTQEGSLYPVLYKLLEQGYISDERVLVGKRMTRVYYHLEPAGEVYLDELLQEYLAFTRGFFNLIESEGEVNEQS